MNDDPQVMGASVPHQMIPLGNPDTGFVLYHWSPIANKAAIEVEGLKIRRKSVEGLWKPPFLAFCGDPMLAWSLSAMRSDYENPHDLWMLWATWSSTIPGGWLEMIPFDAGVPREYRVYRSIPRKLIWAVGTRDRTQTYGD